ncbi:MAG: hypothetical protein GX456_01775 [Verrucomicrobia bacterium]|nr:hypothetical protein [Verrucomicrobiota bacterium]
MKPCTGQGGRSAHTTNKVPVPISASPQTMCLSPYRHPYRQPRGSSTDFSSRRLEQGAIGSPCHDPGAKPKQGACHSIRLTPKGRAVVTALLAAREADTEKLTKLAV